MQAKGRKEGIKNMSDREGTPSFAHDCHSLYAPFQALLALPFCIVMLYFSQV